jgi:hypothetical protein
MKKTPTGTSVGVDDPYEHAGVCDHVTDDGRCRYAFEHAEHDPEFAAERRADGFDCPVADGEAHCASERASGDEPRAGDWEWADCPHYRSTSTDRECERCGLAERRDGQSEGRPLLEEHHLAYDDDRDLGQEITVFLCRWCHAKVHNSWASVADDVNPDPEAIAAQEERRSDEQRELSFETAAERFDSE